MILHQDQAATPQAETAKNVVERMLTHYSSAKSLVGTVKLTQQAANVSVEILTTVQFQNPSLIFIRQQKAATANTDARDVFLSTDGNTLSYTKPEQVLGPDRILQEHVTQHDRTQTVREMYGLFRSTAIDPNGPLEVAIGRTEDLRSLMAQWATMKITGQTVLDSEAVTTIGGLYRRTLTEASSGTYEAYITAQGDFKRYVVKQKYGVPGQNRAVEVISTWDSTLRVNGRPDPSLFKG